jgi:hypothetical protein
LPRRFILLVFILETFQHLVDIARRRGFALLHRLEALFAIDVAARPFIFERPFLRPPALETVVELEPCLWVDGVEDAVQMRVIRIVMRSEHALVLVPLHVFEVGFRRVDHLLARGVFIGMPGQREMLHRLLHRAAAGAGLLLQELGVAVGENHFMHRAGDMVMRAVQRVRPGHAFAGRALIRIVRDVFDRELERGSCLMNARNHARPPAG